MEQLAFDFPTLIKFLVGCRVNGAIQLYHIEAQEHEQAMDAVREGVEGARPIWARVK